MASVRSDNPFPVGVPIERLPEVDSTSLEARRRIAAGAAGPFALVAARQSRGRGRLGRAWTSPPGGLWLTLASPIPGVDPRLGLRAGLAALRGIEGACGPIAALRLKWPNDVMVGDRKVAGVLAEIVSSVGGPWAVVGVGVNANLEPDDLPLAVRSRATTLRAAVGASVPLDRLEAAVLAALLEAIGYAGGADWDLHEAGRRLWGVGREATISLADGTVRTGVIRGLDEDGALCVDTSDGPWRVAAGAELGPLADQSSGASS